LNDIEMHQQQSSSAGITQDHLSMYLLLFADDAVLFSDTKECFQNSLNNSDTYCKKWNLNVNIEINKIIIFRKGGRISDPFKWTFA
jgi:hypothetical protein